MIHLVPDNAEIYCDIDRIPSKVFYENFWSCDDSFTKLDPNKCILVFIPDKQTIQEAEFKRHAIFLSSYFAWKNNKALSTSLMGYISTYNSRENPFFFNPKDDDIKIRMSAIQSALANPDYNLPHINKRLLRQAITRVFAATEQENGFFCKTDNVFSESAIAMLLGRLLSDGGETDKKVFYYSCHSEEEASRIVSLHRTIKNFLQLGNGVFQIQFPLIIFCHSSPIANGNRFAERFPPCEDYSLFKESYYESDHFRKNLGIRLNRIIQYNSSPDSMYRSEKTQKIQDQLQWLKKFSMGDIAIEPGQDQLSFHALIEYIENHWNELSK